MQEARILNRVIRWTPDGWGYEADQRHADLTVRETWADKLSALPHQGGDKTTTLEEESKKLSSSKRLGSEGLQQERTTCQEPGLTFSMQ